MGDNMGNLVGRWLCGVACGLTLFAQAAWAEPPSVAYVFPAGGQRGTKVDVRIGGHYLHEQCNFSIRGPGVRGPASISRTETIWFDGPVIHQPASQKSEDYPKDYAATLEIAADAPLGSRAWRVWNSQGVTSARRFIVGDLPEVVEQEIDGDPIPVPVRTPVTINGRIFPREDVDVWSFDASAGKPMAILVAAQSIGSPLEARLELRDPRGLLVTEATGGAKSDPQIKFVAAVNGAYSLKIHDVKYDGLQPFVYRLTIADDVPGSGELAGGASKSADAAVLGEREPNDDAATAQTITSPTTVRGTIDKPRDVDC